MNKNDFYKILSVKNVFRFFAFLLLLYAAYIVDSIYFENVSFYDSKINEFIALALFAVILWFFILKYFKRDITSFYVFLLNAAFVYSVLMLALKIFIVRETGGSDYISDMVFILMETSYQESGEFLLSNKNARNSLIIFAGITFLYFYIPFRIKGFVKPDIFLLIFFVSLIFFNYAPIKQSFSELKVFSYISEVEEYFYEIETYRKIKAQSDVEKHDYTADASDDSPDKVVLVIGESASRQHMSHYGYFRDTNFYTKKLGDNLDVFTDVISSHSHTLTALPRLFTLLDKSNESSSKWYEHLTLCDVFAEAGYETFWISAQKPYSIHNYDNIPTLIGRSCHHQYFAELSQKKKVFDTDLLSETRKVLTQYEGRKFIVLHLMGSHPYYSSRTPDSFKRSHRLRPILNPPDFMDRKKMELVDAYDYSILFTDKFMYDIIKIFENDSKDSLVVYLPDHGEEVFDVRNYHGHTENNASRFMCEVPLLIWPSQSFDDEVLSRSYQSDFFPHTMMDLAGIQSDIFSPEKSIVHEKFLPEKRIFNKQDYDKTYKNSNPVYRINYKSEKAWVHRVNSIEKLKIVENMFAGIEVDIVIKDDFIDVNHPPAYSIGLYLSEFLSNVENKDLNVWLDIKTGSTLKEKDINLLAEIIEKSNLPKENFILESTVPENSSVFNDAGFVSSFYLSKKCFAARSLSPECRELIKNTPSDYISFDYRFYDTISGEIEAENIPEKSVITWNMGLKFGNSDTNFFKKYMHIVDEDRIDVLLISYATNYNRL